MAAAVETGAATVSGLFRKWNPDTFNNNVRSAARSIIMPQLFVGKGGAKGGDGADATGNAPTELSGKASSADILARIGDEVPIELDAAGGEEADALVPEDGEEDEDEEEEEEEEEEEDGGVEERGPIQRAQGPGIHHGLTGAPIPIGLDHAHGAPAAGVARAAIPAPAGAVPITEERFNDILSLAYSSRYGSSMIPSELDRECVFFTAEAACQLLMRAVVAAPPAYYAEFTRFVQRNTTYAALVTFVGAYARPVRTPVVLHNMSYTAIYS